MKAKIKSVYNLGDFENEYVLMSIVEDCDIGIFLLGDSTYTDDGAVSNKLRHIFWFPDKQVEKGDLVSLWTRPGTNTTTTNKSGVKIHRFYWNLKRAVWNDEGDCAVLLETRDWQPFAVS